MRKRSVGVILTALLLVGPALWLDDGCYSRPNDLSALTTQQWRKDLQYMARNLAEKHMNAFHRVTRAQYDQLVAQIDAALPGLQSSDVPVYFEKLTAAVGDAHTYVDLPTGQHIYPFRVEYFGPDPRVTRTTAEHRGLLGARLLKIGEVEMNQVEARLDEILTLGENTSFYRALYPSFLSSEVLHALGIIADPARTIFTFVQQDGAVVTVTMAPSADHSEQWVLPYAEAPLSVQHKDDDFWFTTLPNTSSLYVIFNSYHGLCHNTARLFEYLDHHAVDRVIIDVRENGGGDYLVGHKCLIAPLLERPALNQRSHLYVITGRHTFSAAMSNAAQFRTETQATLVGEPPGEVPNSYQERRGFDLPNSHLTVNYSARYYKFLPQDVPALLPDIEVDPDWSHYEAGRDPALERILSK